MPPLVTSRASLQREHRAIKTLCREAVGPSPVWHTRLRWEPGDGRSASPEKEPFRHVNAGKSCGRDDRGFRERVQAGVVAKSRGGEAPSVLSVLSLALILTC
jgi:hypothetical protein